MTPAELKACICGWISSQGVTAVQEPSNHPAPEGLHVAVALQSLEQNGRPITPSAPDEDSGGSVAVEYVATVRLYEVGGDGGTLRELRNGLELDSLGDYARAQFPDTDAGDDASFSTWEVGGLARVDSQDGGGNWVSQWTLQFTAQFNDYAAIDAPRIASVEGTLTGDGDGAESAVAASTE